MADSKNEEVLEYEDDEEEVRNNAQTTGEKTATKKTGDYVAINTASFKDFLLKTELLRAITDCGFEHPSEVQHECIPQAVLGTDVICQAKSGMGKTAVFVLSVLQQIDPSQNKTTCLVLCHTRELAYQIRNEFDRFKKYLSAIRTEVFYGGVPVIQNKEVLKKESKPHIVIGTPGRILQLASEKALDLSNLKHFILDECDQMLDALDMRRDVQKILRLTPHQKQVMMFSATLDESIRSVCKRFMQNPLEIYINDTSKLTLHGLQQYYISVAEKDKTRKLTDLLDSLDFNQAVIFVSTVSRADVLHNLLHKSSFPSICIHAGLKQEERISRYKSFKNFDTRIMVSTNVLGRGIDIERVNVVINYDMPENTTAYLHRVGRAGRFGTKGLAISFISSEDNAKTLNSVQEKFNVSISPMPDHIDASSYSTS